MKFSIVLIDRKSGSLGMDAPWEDSANGQVTPFGEPVKFIDNVTGVTSREFIFGAFLQNTFQNQSTSKGLQAGLYRSNITITLANQ